MTWQCYLSSDYFFHAQRQVAVDAGTDEAGQPLHAGLLLTHQGSPVLGHQTPLSLHDPVHLNHHKQVSAWSALPCNSRLLHRQSKMQRAKTSVTVALLQHDLPLFLHCSMTMAQPQNLKSRQLTATVGFTP